MATRNRHITGAILRDRAQADHARAVEVLARSSGGARMLCAGATKLCRASGGTMDAFSEVLSGVRLKGAMFFSAEFSAPWRLSTPHCRVLAATLAPGAPHMLIYHFVVHGSARASPRRRDRCRIVARRHRGLSARGSTPLERRLRSERPPERRDTPEDRDTGLLTDAGGRWRRHDAIRVRLLDL